MVVVKKWKVASAMLGILFINGCASVSYYGQLANGQLKIQANNPEQEEAEELLDVQYAAGEMEIGFNVSYVLDVLNTLKCDQIRISLSDSISSAIIEDFDSQDAQYVVMPMRI